MDKFAELLEAEFDLSFGDETANGHAGPCLDNTIRDDVTNAPSPKQIDDMRAARSRRIPDGPGAQHGIAYCGFRTDVRTRLPVLDGDSHFRARNTDAASRDDVTVALQSIDRIGRKNDNIETLAFLNASGRFNAANRHNRNVLPRHSLVRLRELRQNMTRSHRRYDGQ
ncbi:hypothetical protein PPGU19_048870 [Paraburkholderia sp. PGU19]|nr:hypothetical protein PPGU19_048870 [Paraburkholderia sp. PGU19]